MLITPHFLTGAVVASQVPSFWPAAIAVLVLHYVMDYIPHKDTIGGTHLNRANVVLNIIDFIVAIILFFVLVKPSLWVYGFAVATIGMVPDIIEVPLIFWPKLKKLPVIGKLSWWHTETLQYGWADTGWWLGLLPQAIVFIGALYFLL